MLVHFRTFLFMLFCLIRFFMVMVCFLISMVCIRMLMLFFLHAFYRLFFNEIYGIHHLKHMEIFILHGFQNSVYPFVAVSSGIDKKVRILNGDNVLRTRFKAVCFRTRLNKHGDIRIFLCDCARKIIRREVCCYNFKLISLTWCIRILLRLCSLFRIRGHGSARLRFFTGLVSTGKQ